MDVQRASNGGKLLFAGGELSMSAVDNKRFDFLANPWKEVHNTKTVTAIEKLHVRV